MFVALVICLVCLNLTSVLRFNFEKLGYHKVVDSVEVPCNKKCYKNLSEHTFEPTNVWQKIKECVSAPWVLHAVQIHFNGNWNPYVVSWFIWQNLLFLQLEQVFLRWLSPWVKLNYIIVLKREVSLIYLKRNNLANLAAYRYVANTWLLDCGSFKESLWIEPNLVVKKHDIFAL